MAVAGLLVFSCAASGLPSLSSLPPLASSPSRTSRRADDGVVSLLSGVDWSIVPSVAASAFGRKPRESPTPRSGARDSAQASTAASTRAGVYMTVSSNSASKHPQPCPLGILFPVSRTRALPQATVRLASSPVSRTATAATGAAPAGATPPSRPPATFPAAFSSA